MPSTHPARSLTTLLVVAFAATFTLASPPPLEKNCKIVPREEWGARFPRNVNKRDPLSSFLLVHHGGIDKYCTTKESCSEIIKTYQNLHMDDRGWDDIGYSFLIGEDGRIYEGRGWDRVGAHAPQYNHISIGVCFIGDFSDRLPNKVALDALRDLVACSVGSEHLKTNYTLLGHRQARNTLCPGETLYQEIAKWPHWKPNPSPRMYSLLASASSNSAEKYKNWQFFVSVFVSFFLLNLN